jgi:hypothetical protein
MLAGLILLIVLVSAAQVLIVVGLRNNPSLKVRLLVILGVVEAALIVAIVWHFLGT